MTPTCESEYPESPDFAVSGLFDVAPTTLPATFPTLSFDDDDIELVLDALRFLVGGSA